MASEECEALNPSSYGVFIPGEAGRLFAQIYVPCGNPPHSTVILCHGFPGNERIMDFATTLRDHGFCTIHFHYRGSWGSDGSYTFNGAMDDGDAVLNYALENREGFFDTSKILILGHSLGGLVAAKMLATRKETIGGALLMPGDVKYIFVDQMADPELHDFLYAAFSEGCEWVKDCTCDGLIEEACASPEQFMLPTYAAGLSVKPVLLANGSLDPIITRDGHIDPLVNAVAAHGGEKLTTRTYETDHGFNLNREFIKEDICNYLKQVLSEI